MRTLLTLLLLIPCLARSADPARIEQAVNQYLDQRAFSGIILVAENGTPIFHQSYGFAYYATPDTIKNGYHFSIASVTKLFTSIRILQLVENGKLSLDDSLVDVLPGYEDLLSADITIHHLLLHISGLPNEPDRLYRHPHTPQKLVRTVLQKGRPNDIGNFNYNNVDYWLLGLLIEQVTGNAWEDEISKYILEPLGMTETGFLKYGYYPKRFAYTYSKKWLGLKQDPLFYIENFYAAGNMYSNAMDLLKLDQALHTNQLLSDESRNLLSQSNPEYNYAGYGVWNYPYPFVEGNPMIMERRGKVLGANVVLVRIPEDRYTIIIQSNDDRFNPDSFGDSSNLREILIQTLYQ